MIISPKRHRASQARKKKKKKKNREQGNERTEGASTVGVDGAFWCICNTIEALLQPRVLDKRAGVVGIGLRDDGRTGSGVVALSTTSRGVILGVAAVMMRNGNTDADTDCDKSDNDNGRAHHL